MSNNTKTSVHPQIKNIIHNLDLDLGLELNRYEQSLRRDSALIAQSSNYDSSFYHYVAEKPNLTVFYQSAIIEEEEEIIPVNSRLIEEPTSILDRILTPWGIFGIIFFLGANLFILFNWEDLTTVEKTVNNNPANLNNNSNLSSNINVGNNQVSNNGANNNNMTTSSQTTETLPSSDNLSNSVAQNPSPYPDLKTALFREIQQPQLPKTINSSKNQKNNVVTSKVKTENITATGQKYYLLSNYDNMTEFTRIKDILPTASIANIDNKMKIQLAVFDNENEAKKKSQQLKEKGVDNYLYSSKNGEGKK